VAKHSWQNVNDFLQSDEWQAYESSVYSNDLYISNPDRAIRCVEAAAKHGSDGSTHAEIIQDWRDFLSSLKVYDPDFDDPEDEADRDLTQEQYDKISADIDACEKWHDENGSLNQQFS
jgi:hypothetical protein